MKGSMSKRGEAPEESHVVRLIHPKTEAVPVPIGIGDGGILRRAGFRGSWTARHRRSSSDRQPRLARCV